MKRGFSAADEAFRLKTRQWFESALTGPFAALRFRGGPGDEHSLREQRKQFEAHLGASGMIGIGWPREFGGKGLSITRQVIFHEEYARAGGPGRVGHIGEQLLAPTLIAHGTPQQQERYLPGILRGTELWCQGYSEPNAGSDLANVKTKATYDAHGKQWRLQGQKVWTSLAMDADFCFVVARADPMSVGHKGLGFFLLPMNQPGVRVVPIQQLTGTSEFSEVFFDDAVVSEDDVVGVPGEGWSIAMALLGYERGISTLGQQMHFQIELEAVMAEARKRGGFADPWLRRRLAQAHGELKIMRANSLRMLSGWSDGRLAREALIYKVFWAQWHRRLGELAMEVLGEDAEILADAPYALTPLQALFLFVRSDTIYGGTDEIQKNIIAEKGLGLPREPRGQEV